MDGLPNRWGFENRELPEEGDWKKEVGVEAWGLEELGRVGVFDGRIEVGWEDVTRLDGLVVVEEVTLGTDCFWGDFGSF